MAVLVEIVVLTVKSAMPQKALAVLIGLLESARWGCADVLFIEKGLAIWSFL